MPLVNRTWLMLVAYITSRDIHLYSSHSSMAFLTRFSKNWSKPGVPDLFTAERTRVTDDVCRSLTFNIDGTFLSSSDVPPQYVDLPMSAITVSTVVTLVLPELSAPDRQSSMPNLRHISFLYTHWGYNRAFEHLEMFPLPRQVTHISVAYVFPDPNFQQQMCHHWMCHGAHTRFARQPHPKRYIIGCRSGECRQPCTDEQGIPNLRHLSLSGVVTPFIAAILRVYPSLETLELGEASWISLERIAPLPPTTRTVVLRYPGAVSGERTQRWRLCEAVCKGLFSPGDRVRRTGSMFARIVIRSGTPDLIVFEAVRCECERFGVELVHQSDDSRCLDSVVTV